MSLISKAFAAYKIFRRDNTLDCMGASHLDLLPVVNRAIVHQLEGVVTLQDVLDSYGVGTGR